LPANALPPGPQERLDAVQFAGGALEADPLAGSLAKDQKEVREKIHSHVRHLIDSFSCRFV
jgi:hypothetical protein